MKKEEAIEMLKSKMDGSVDTSYEWAETVRMAIEALETQELYLKALERMIEFHKTFTRILDGERKGGEEYEKCVEQMEHDSMYEPTYNQDDGSM